MNTEQIDQPSITKQQAENLQVGDKILWFANDKIYKVTALTDGSGYYPPGADLESPDGKYSFRLLVDLYGRYQLVKD